MTRSANRVLKFGIVTVVTDSSIPTVDLAQWAEDRGFESLSASVSWFTLLMTGSRTEDTRRSVSRLEPLRPRPSPGRTPC